MAGKFPLDNKTAALTEDPSFEAVLDAACERLWEKQIQYSVRRINEMDEKLLTLENELNEFINLKRYQADY